MYKTEYKPFNHNEIAEFLLAKWKKLEIQE